jgi:hypothetical protein
MNVHHHPNRLCAVEDPTADQLRALAATLPAAHCHRCGCDTPTTFLRLSSGHVGRCCATCRATRKGAPFIGREELQKLATNAGSSGLRGISDEVEQG